MKINQGQKTLLGMGEFTEKEFARSVNELADHFGEGFFVSSPSEWEKASQTATIQYGEEKDEAFSLHHLSDGSVVLEERFGEVSQAFLSHFWEVLEHTFRLSRLPKLEALTDVPNPHWEEEGIQKVADADCYETFGVPTLIAVNQDEVLVEDKHFAEQV